MICTLEECERPAHFIIHTAATRAYLGRSCHACLPEWSARHTPVLVSLFAVPPVVVPAGATKRLRRSLRRRAMRRAP